MPACARQAARGGARRPLPAPSPYPRMSPQLMLHTRARPASAGTAESCGTALSVAVMVGFPYAQTPSLHMGARPPHTTLTMESLSFQQNQLPPRRGPTLPCATPKTPTPSRYTTPHTTNPPQTRTGTGPISTRRCTDLAAETDRSRGGNGPISRNRMRYSQAPHQTDRPH